MLPLPDGKVVLWRTAGLGSRAATILHLPDTGRQPHLYILNTVPTIRRQHTVINTTSPTGLATLSTCADAVAGWHIRNDLLLNPTKTEAIVTGTLQQIAKLDQLEGVTMCGAAVPFGSTLRILEVMLDSEHTFDEHITVIVCAYNFHLCLFCHIRHLIDREVANTIACLIVCSRLDYYNSILYGVTENNIGRLQRIQNALARVVCDAPYRSSATILRRSLHWLSIKQRIVYKVVMMTFKVWLHQQPLNISELVVDYRPSQTLQWSGMNLLAEPRTKTLIASRAFSSVAPHVWISLPPLAHSPTSIETFRSRVKTFLFEVAYKDP